MKKKAVAAAQGLAISVVLGIVLFITADANAQLPDRNLSLADLAQQLKTPDNIAHYLWRNFLFENDQRLFGREEYRQSAEEFLSNHRGDCEDFANMAYTLLRLNGIEAFLMNIYGSHFAHTICIFKENGKYQAIDGSDLKRVQAENLGELAGRIHPSWKEAKVGTPLKARGENGFFVQFAKSLQAKSSLNDKIHAPRLSIKYLLSTHIIALEAVRHIK